MQFQICVIACEMNAIMTLQKYQKVLRVSSNLWVFDWKFSDSSLSNPKNGCNLGVCKSFFPFFPCSTMIN
jgi:hypothetical protein